MLATRRGPEDPQRARLRSKTEALRKEWSELPPEQAARQHLERLRADYDRRLKRYEERESDYQSQIRRLEDEVVAQHDILDPARPVDPDPLLTVADEHRDLLASLDQIDARRRRVVAERKKDVEAAERERLSKPRQERDTMRDAREKRDRAWRLKAEHFQKEKQWALGVCGELETLNAGLEAQNEDLRNRKQAGDQDRQFLISQLSAVQRDNAKCRQALRDFSRPRPPPPQKEDEIKSTGPMASDARELRTKELRKLEAGLDHRQRLLMNRRREAADHAREAALLQKLVRDRLIDVKDAVDAERAECDLADVDEKKDSVVAKLEWTSRVVSLLYDRAFPAGK